MPDFELSVGWCICPFGSEAARYLLSVYNYSLDHSGFSGYLGHDRCRFSHQQVIFGTFYTIALSYKCFKYYLTYENVITIYILPCKLDGIVRLVYLCKSFFHNKRQTAEAWEHKCNSVCVTSQTEELNMWLFPSSGLSYLKSKLHFFLAWCK